MSPPVLLPDVDVVKVIMAGALNPLALWVAFYMGRKADQLAKILVAGFAGGTAACLTLVLAKLTGIPGADDLSRAIAGVFIVGLICGMAVAWAAFRTRKP